MTREGLVLASPERGIKTKVVVEDGHYIIKTVQDITGHLEHNKDLNDAGLTKTVANGRHVGSIPATLYYRKKKEFGGSFDDPDPQVRRKWIQFLNSNEFHRLRVHQGRL